MPNLKEAREKKKLEEFIKEHEADPEGDLDKLDEVIRSGKKKKRDTDERTLDEKLKKMRDKKSEKEKGESLG